MSNRKYRSTEPTPRESEHEAAKVFIATVIARGDDFAKSIRSLLQSEFDKRGGKLIDLEIDALTLVLEESKLDRTLEIKFKQALVDQKPGEAAPVPPKLRGVSAAATVSASRRLGQLRQERELLKSNVEIDVAEIVMRTSRERRAAQAQAPAQPSTPTATTPHASPGAARVTPVNCAATASA
ncbi:MAG: hypothetical protein KBG84_07700 [Planctomycetes bacterium]|nr:hypothetical protein [Planctomycetota bacterium]